MVREMRALQQGAIGRIAIERWAGGDQRADSRPIGRNRRAKLKTLSCAFA
jgi:hypothetical protein